MTQDEKDTLARLKSYGNMSQAEAVEYHRLLNLEAAEVAASTEVVTETPAEPVVETPVVPEEAPVVTEPVAPAAEEETNVASE